MFLSSSLLKKILLFSVLLNMSLALAKENLSKESTCLSKYPITADQWALFLNSVHVDPADQNDVRDLYHPEMFDDGNSSSLLQVNITKKSNKSDDQQQWTYSARHVTSGFFWTTTTSYGSHLITNIPLDDAKRYCNWCAHGSPHASTLEEALAVTENGVYDFTDGKKGDAVVDAIYSLPTGDLPDKAIDNKSDNRSKEAMSSHLASGMQTDSASKAIVSTFSQDSSISSLSSFLESLWNVTYAQIATNLIEIAMNACSLSSLWSSEEDLFSWGCKIWSESLKPFTYPRIAMNCFFSIITAAGISTEVTPYLKDDSLESIGWTIAETVAVMALVESGAFLLEYPTAWLWYYFSSTEEGVTAAQALTKAIATVADGLTWNRLFLNVVYIGLNTYFSVSSTLQDYEKQHSRS